MSSNDDQFDDGLENFDEVAVDEFGNDIVPGEESFAEEEDWETYDEQDEDSGDEQPSPRAGKKSGNFNKILIGAAVLVGAGVLVFQLSRSPTPAPAPVPPPAASAPLPAVPPPANPDATQGGFLTNPENMAALEQDIAKTYENTEIAEYGEEGTETVAPADDVAAPPMPTAMTQAETVNPAPALVADMPPPVPSGMDELSLAATPPVPAPAPAPAPTPATADEPAIRMPSASDVLLKQPTAETAPVDTALAEQVAVVDTVPAAALVDKIDLVLARLDQLETDVKTLQARDGRESADALDDLRKSIAALEKKIGGAEKAPTKPASPVTSAEEAPPPKPQILGSSAPEASPKPAPASTPQKAAIQWVLKGAQPGRAMVSRPGENEMRTVEVGDSLPGIGKITGISYQSGRWVVQGTQGRITQ
ncbi:MAG: hypothetical protein ACXW4B_05705 [Micavibrio sp.]